MLTGDVTCLQSTRDDTEIYKHTNTTEKRSMLSLRHEVTETQKEGREKKERQTIYGDVIYRIKFRGPN
jgi:hypothetical protein